MDYMTSKMPAMISQGEISSCDYIRYISWWFGTCILFVPYIGNFIIPTDFHIFQRGRSTTVTRYALIGLKWPGVPESGNKHGGVHHDTVSWEAVKIGFQLARNSGTWTFPTWCIVEESCEKTHVQSMPGKIMMFPMNLSEYGNWRFTFVHYVKHDIPT